MAALLSCQQVDNTLHNPPSYCRSGFDFSLLFEELILGVLPLGVVLLLIPFQVGHLLGRPRKVVASWLAWAKTVRTQFLLPDCLPSCHKERIRRPARIGRRDFVGLGRTRDFSMTPRSCR